MLSIGFRVRQGGMGMTRTDLSLPGEAAGITEKEEDPMGHSFTPSKHHGKGFSDLREFATTTKKAK